MLGVSQVVDASLLVSTFWGTIAIGSLLWWFSEYKGNIKGTDLFI